MAAEPPPPPQSLSADGGAHISLFLDTDLGTRLALNVAADSTIRGLKSQVAVEHAAAFPDLGTVSVKSFQVLRKGAMYHLSDSMAVRSAFAKVKAWCFLHVKIAAAEKDTHYCRDEDRGKSSDKLPLVLEGGEDAAVCVNFHAHDVHPPSSSQRDIEKKSTSVCLATDVRTNSVPVIDKSESCKQGKKHMSRTEGVYVNSTSVVNTNGLTNQSNVILVGKEVHTREEDLLHSVGDRELGFVSADKKMGIREETLGELHKLDDLSQEKDHQKARVTGSFDTSAVDPVRETNDSKTRDGENFDKLPLEINPYSRELLSNTSFQQEVDGNIKEDSIQLENSIITGKNKKRKKSKLVTSEEVSAREMTEPATGAVEVPKPIDEDLLHENQGLQGNGASDIEMTSRDKTKVIPPDMLLLSSQLNTGSQVTKHVQLGTDAQATSDLGADQSNIDLVHERYENPVIGDISISACKVVAGEVKYAKGTNDGDHDGSTVDASNMEKGSKREDVLETADNISQKKICKKSKKASSVGLTSMDTAEAKDQCGYGEKAGKSDIISTQQEIVNDPYKRQTASNVQQGDSNVIENPNDDVKRKKKRRRHQGSSKDDRTQDAAKSSGFIMNSSSTQNTSIHCLDAKQITLRNIGQETADEIDKCRREKVAEPVIVSTQGVNVNDPSNAQQGDSDVIKNPNGDGKRKKKKRHLESLKDDDPTQDVTKPSGLITGGSSVNTDSGTAIQSLGEQVGHVPAEDMKGENCTKAELFQGGSAIDAPASTGQIMQKKSKRSSKSHTSKVEEVTHSTHGHENQFANDSQDKHVADIGGTHNNEKIGAPIESPVVQKDDTIVEHGSDADFMNSRAQQGAVIPEGSSDAVEPNDYVAVHPDNDKINFIDHFSPSATNGPSDSAKNNDETIREVKGKKKSKRKADIQSQHTGSIEPNDFPESDAHTDKTSLVDHFGSSNVGVPSVSAENMNREDGNVKKAKGNKKSKTKSDLLKSESLNPMGGHQDTDNCTQDLMHSDAQKGRMEHGNTNENNDKVIQNGSMLQQEAEDATRDITLEKKPHQSMFGADSQTNLPIVKDHAHMSKEQRNSTSQTNFLAMSRKHDGSIDGRTSTNHNAVSNPAQSFPMSPQASNESAYGTPAVNQFRVAVRKVTRKRFEQIKDKSKKDISKRGTGAIFGDTISESSDEVLNTMNEKAAMENSSSTSVGSGISSAAWDGDMAALSQKSDIQSVLRDSRSYKKARLKPTELLDDTEVPDSQPHF